MRCARPSFSLDDGLVQAPGGKCSEGCSRLAHLARFAIEPNVKVVGISPAMVRFASVAVLIAAMLHAQDGRVRVRTAQSRNFLPLSVEFL